MLAYLFPNARESICKLDDYLRLICDEDADFANPIEPSARGGAKIAQAISRFAGGATPRSSVFTDQ